MLQAAPPELSSLTQREQQVLDLLNRGLTNEDIGRVLKIAPSTAKNHVSNLLKKLQVANRTEAVGLFGSARPTPLNPTEPHALPPAIGVLRMRCADADPLTRQIADGMVDDLITSLSRRWYPVIARCSTFNVIDCEGSDACSAGKKLGARYLVESSLNRSDQRLRCSVRLVDVEHGHVVWAERYDRRSEDLFDVLDELSTVVMESVFAGAAQHVARTLEHLPQAQLLPWQIAVRGMSHFWQSTAAHNVQARALFAQALQSERDQRLSLYGTALTHQREIYEQWSPDPDTTVRELTDVTQHFLSYWPDDPWALLMSAYTEVYRGAREEATTHVQRALEREPSSLAGRSLYGQLLAMDGQTARAVKELEKALLLSPQTPDRWVQECVMALAYFAGEAYEEAVKWGEISAKSRRAGAMAHSVLATSYFHLGERSKAKTAHTRFMELAPTFSDARFRPMIAATRPEISKRYLDGLRGAAAS